MTSRDQYDKLCAAYESATEAGDAEAMGRLYTEDALVLAPRQPPVSGRQAILQMYKNLFNDKGYKMTINVQDFEENGDLAYGVGTFDALDYGTGNYLEVLKRQSDGSYQMHRACWNTH
jgi:ketosteroid isomerase-like protein